jgi:hypothetical protein
MNVPSLLFPRWKQQFKLKINDECPLIVVVSLVEVALDMKKRQMTMSYIHHCHLLSATMQFKK